MIRIELDGADRIALPAAIANGLNSRELTLTSRSQRHLLLTTEGGGAGQIALAGAIGELQVVEVLSIVNMFRKSVLLHFNLEGGSKDLHFSATSTFPEEELGEFLLIAGKIDRDTLIKARQAAGNDPQALRAQLLQGGRITEQDLQDANSAQIEAIVYHLIPCQQGDFIFVQRRNATAATPLALRTQNLIMEGLRRSDEQQLFMRTLRSHDTMPVATGSSVTELPAAEERLLALASSGRLTVRELIARSGLGEFRTLSLLHRLTGQQLLTIPALETPPEIPAELAEILKIANGVLAALYQKINEKNHDFGQEMRRFLRDLPQPFATVLRHVTITNKGTIDGSRITANLANYPVDEQRALLAETLSELVFMACMAARRDLDDSDSLRLVQQAQEIAIRINQIKERKNS